jgi:hypothetical protein
MNNVLEYDIKVIKSLEEIEDIRFFWEAHQCYPDADIDFYIAFCRANKANVSPHITVLMHQGKPDAMMIGRIDCTDFKFNFGYKVLFGVKVRSLSILYGGIIGNLTDLAHNLLLDGIMDSLSKGEADIAFFNHIISDSYIYNLVIKRPGFLFRDHSPKSYLHWCAKLPDSFNAYQDTRSKKFKRTLNLFNNRTKKQYGDNQSVVCLQQVDEFDRIINDIEMIASKTYHRGMNTGFIDNDATRDRIKLALKRNLFRAYIMYLDQKPSAYMMGMKYNHTFFPQATGYDPGYNHYSPGTLIIMEMFKRLFDEGDIQAVDFGFGDAFYKHNFCEDHWQESPVFIYAPTLKGGLLNAIKSLLNIISGFTADVLKKFNLTDKVKKIWRDKLADDKSNSNEPSE